MSICLPSDVLFELLLKITFPTLAHLCSSNKEINKICNDEYFWQLKTQQDYPNKSLPPQLTWKQYYLALVQHKIREIPVYVNDILYKNIFVLQNESIQSLATKLFGNNRDFEYYKIIFREFGVPVVTLRYIERDANKTIADFISEKIWMTQTNYLSIKIAPLTEFERSARGPIF